MRPVKSLLVAVWDKVRVDLEAVKTLQMASGEILKQGFLVKKVSS